MKHVLKDIFDAVASNKKLLAVLIDPEKFQLKSAADFLRKIPQSTTHLLIGGSTADSDKTEACVKSIKAETDLPVVIFPGDYRQITHAADALLFLSLISGRNPEYLIGQQVKSVQKLKSTNLEIIPTGYILIDGGKKCAIEKVSQTQPLSQNDPEAIVETALAGQYSGKQLIYLEAGSGALNPVAPQVINSVKNSINIPLIVGGGIRSGQQLEAAYTSGADMVVIGTAFEKGDFFLH